MRIKDNTKVLIDETQKRHAKRERQKAQRREQERRRQARNVAMFEYCETSNYGENVTEKTREHYANG